MANSFRPGTSGEWVCAGVESTGMLVFWIQLDYFCFAL